MTGQFPTLPRWSIAALIALAFACASGAASAQTIQTSVPHAILVDADTHSVLFEKDADAPAVPASTVKIMTAEVVFNELAEGRIKLDDQFLITENAWRTGGAPARSSSMFAAVNSRVRVEDLIRGLVIDSGNDAAIALAEGIAGSEGAFATLMMKRGRELGLTQSVFTNSWGKDDPEQRVSPREMTILAAHVIATYPEYYKYFAEKEFTWNKIKQTNRNPLLTMDIGADGLKTGNIDASGYGLVGSAVQNGQRLILALYGAASAKERAEEARKLLMWGFRSFDSKTIFAAGETVGYAKVYGGVSFEAPLVAEHEVKILVPRVGGEKFTGRIVYDGPLMAPVAAGKEVARLKIFRGSTEVLDLPLKTAAAVEVGSLPRRAMDAGLEYIGDLFRKYVGSKLDKKYVANQ
ncbi:D-alanyl-D-alanine carboxypeptidase family protein [Methylocella tundrae]|uniref:serine-type D-Ala-D-Ala carboxypeptidase n=1 Tax=Methylocella tundrae TaxID=227605 RepID=A0A4U8Z0I7_METTU|nr:Serine-type D-Ala-D-Ala carboxypeptidase [Methylocella tundrae]